jgi:hypothetical protein
MNTAKLPTIESFGLLDNDIEAQIAQRLQQRLANDKEYSRAEIEAVTNRNHRLTDSSFELAQDDYERLRVLCILSQCALVDVSKISSHRPIVGKCIVAAKRVLWRIISSQLEKTFSGIQEFCCWMLVSHIKTLERVDTLERSLKR